MLKRILAALLAAVTLLTVTPLATAASANPFSDVSPSDYFSNAVQWAVNEQVTKGTTATTFSPNTTCTRAQIITMIWRSLGCPEPETVYNDNDGDSVARLSADPELEPMYDSSDSAETVEPELEDSYTVRDVYRSDYYYTAVRWALSIGAFSGDSFEPNKPCTRAQAVWFLWIANGMVTVNGKAQLRDTSFTDVTADTCKAFTLSAVNKSYAYAYMSSLIINGIDYNNYYFVMALVWATERGIVTGTTDTTFSPDNTCTRAQIVAMLYRNATAAEKCADGNHNFLARSGADKYIMKEATCSSDARYYTSCVTCGLSSKDYTGSSWYDRMNFFSPQILHSYELCVEPTAARYGLKYCTVCGHQEHVAKLSDHTHQWVHTHSLVGAYYAYDYIYGGKSTLLEYVLYADDWLTGNRSIHYTIFKNSLAEMDEAGKYYYKNGKPVGLIDDHYLGTLTLGSSCESTMYYYCSICGEKQTHETLNELYGPNAIYGTNDTVYGK